MAASILSILMIFFSSTGGLNELLDVADPQSFLKAQGIEYEVEALTGVLAEPQTRVLEEEKLQEIKKLLAIRALGELKDVAAIPALQQAAGMKGLFYEEHAARAIAKIEGKPYAAKSASVGALQSDLALLPSGLGAVVQMRVPASEKINVRKILGDVIKSIPDAPGEEEMLKELNGMIAGFAGKVGNIRLDSITIGLSEQLNDDEGFVVVVARGLYDHRALESFVSEAASPELQEIGGTVFLKLDRNSAMAPVAKDRLLFVAGAGWEQLPLKQLAANVKTPPAEPSFGPELARVIKRTKKEGSIWGAMLVSEGYKQAPPLAPFDEVILSTRVLEASNKTVVTIEGTGKDEKAIGQSIAEMKQAVTGAIAEMEGQGPALAPILELMKGMKFYSMGQSGSISIEFEGDAASAAGGLLPLIFLGRSESRTLPQRAVPGPAPVPVP